MTNAREIWSWVEVDFSADVPITCVGEALREVSVRKGQPGKHFPSLPGKSKEGKMSSKFKKVLRRKRW